MSKLHGIVYKLPKMPKSVIHVGILKTSPDSIITKITFLPQFTIATEEEEVELMDRITKPTF